MSDALHIDCGPATPESFLDAVRHCKVTIESVRFVEKYRGKAGFRNRCIIITSDGWNVNAHHLCKFIRSQCRVPILIYLEYVRDFEEIFRSGASEIISSEMSVPEINGRFNKFMKSSRSRKYSFSIIYITIENSMISYDPISMVIANISDGKSIQVTKSEGEILNHVILHPNRLFDKETLFNLWLIRRIDYPSSNFDISLMMVAKKINKISNGKCRIKRIGKNGFIFYSENV